MNSRIYLSLAVFICLALLISSCGFTPGGGLGGGVPGSGNIRTETRDTGSFTSLIIEYATADVHVEFGEKESVEIVADDNLLPQLSTQAASGRLIIKSTQTDWKTSVNPSAPVKITVTARSLDEIIVSAPVGTLQVDGLKAGTFKFVLSGGADIHLNDIQVDLLDADFTGAGSVFVSGTARELKLLHSGLGAFDASSLPCVKATVELSGMGDATVNVEQELIATLTGAGSIKYYGTPLIQQEVKGAGAVKPAE